jgi:hypothetical protein
MASDDEKSDAELTYQVELCFLRARTCLEIASRLAPGEDQKKLFEMAEAWRDFGTLLMGSRDDPDFTPRPN